LSPAFWDDFDDRCVDVHPGFESLAPSRTVGRVVDGTGLLSRIGLTPDEGSNPSPSAQNVLIAVCLFCGWAGDDVMLGVCADCVEG
jgi:hypothetical protein